MCFAGIQRPEGIPKLTRAHLIAWRDELCRRGLGGATIRHRLAALASLFEYLCEKNCRRPGQSRSEGVEQPRTESGEGKTPAIGDPRARDLLAAPDRYRQQPTPILSPAVHPRRGPVTPKTIASCLVSR